MPIIRSKKVKQEVLAFISKNDKLEPNSGVRKAHAKFNIPKGTLRGWKKAALPNKSTSKKTKVTNDSKTKKITLETAAALIEEKKGDILVLKQEYKKLLDYAMKQTIEAQGKIHGDLGRNLDLMQQLQVLISENNTCLKSQCNK